MQTATVSRNKYSALAWERIGQSKYGCQTILISTTPPGAKSSQRNARLVKVKRGLLFEQKRSNPFFYCFGGRGLYGFGKWGAKLPNPTNGRTMSFLVGCSAGFRHAPAADISFRVPSVQPKIPKLRRGRAVEVRHHGKMFALRRIHQHERDFSRGEILFRFLKLSARHPITIA